jgi:alpha-methylacyl-CoA racemase
VAPPAPLLDGVTVLDLASVGPAARASRILADYGARVVKIGPTSRKGSVQIQPPFYSYGAGRGMQRVRIDLKAERGKETFLRLASKADVVIESFRPGVAARMGIGYADVRKRNARIVYCSTSGYGQDGARSKWAGHDLNYLAVAGYLDCSGRRADGGPALPGATVADSAAGGMHAVIAILAALLGRAKSGQGAYLDVAVADGVLQLMSLHADRFLATREAPGPGSDILTGRYACYDVYRARDGKWLAVAAIEPAFFANLCKALGLDRWIEHQMNDARQAEIRADFAKAFAARDRDAWIAELSPNDTCVSPVYSIPEATGDAGFEERKVFARARDDAHGEFRQIGAVLAGGERELPVHDVRDAGATDSDEVLLAAGLAREEIEALKRDAVVE